MEPKARFWLVVAQACVSFSTPGYFFSSQRFHFSRIGGEWPAILVALVASTSLTLIVTALVLRLLLRGKEQPPS